MIRAVLLLVASVSVLPVCGWEFGTVNSGDMFVYDVCDYRTIDATLGKVRDCYELEMRIIDRAQSSLGPVWIYQITMSSLDFTINDIILIDDGFNIRPFDSRYVSESISHTIFWMNHHARIISFDPILGESVPSTSLLFDDYGIVVSDFASFDDFTEYQITFTGDKLSGILWIRDGGDDDVSLPTRASFFTEKASRDVLLFTFELKSITDSTWARSARLGELSISVASADSK